MEKIRLKVLSLAVVTIVVTFLIQGTLAYYSTVGKATNVVTSGNIQFIIHEKTADGDDFPENGVSIVPGDVVSKEVSFESDCNHPFYLRTRVTYGIDSTELTAADCFKLDIDEENWLLHSDGWYYYKGIVEPGQTTPEVFTEVEIIGDKVDNDYIGKTLTLTVDAQAVQSENNPVSGTDTFSASGWPQE